VTEREDFGRVSEGYWTFTWGVPSSENVDKQGDKTNSDCSSVFWDQEAETCSEKGPSHLREGEEKE
jgi:hypothetical protein